MTGELHRAVGAACLWLPEVAEVRAHGAPCFNVRGKTFAMLFINHHGDGRIALWLNVGHDAQQERVQLDARRYFVPPYVGPRGWLGVRLDRGLSWRRIVELTRTAYLRTAPAALAAQIGKAPLVRGPQRPSLESLDPLQAPRARRLIEQVRRLTRDLPEVREVRQLGRPGWAAGTRTFAWIEHRDERLWLCAWVGVERQSLMLTDSRYRVPPYVGHRGWIALDVSAHAEAREIDTLIRESYRHFALKRMLRALPEGVPA